MEHIHGEEKGENGRGGDVLYWRWNWIFDLKMGKVFSQASNNFFCVVPLSFGIYQLEQNLFDKLLCRKEKKAERKARERKRKMSSGKLLKFNEDLSMEYVLITFFEIISFWFIFRLILDTTCESKHHDEHLTDYHSAIENISQIFMLSSVSRVATSFYIDGIPKVDHVIQNVVDKSESVDIGSNFNCPKPSRSNLGPCGLPKWKLFIAMDGERARHFIWGASEGAWLCRLRFFSRWNDNLRCWCFHRLDRWRTHFFLRK